MKQTLIIALVTIAATICYGDDDRSFAMYWENDGTFVKPNDRTDRHYTNGLKFVYTHQPDLSAAADCNWLRKLGKWNNFSDKNTEVSTALGYFVGHNIFTPDHVGHPEEREIRDRVFAAWLYGGIFAQRATSEKLEHFELSVGLLGPSAHGEDIQKFIHDVVGADEPNGWPKQLQDEFAIDFTWFTRQRADAVTFAHTSSFDSHLEYGFTAGSVHRNAVLSVLFRAGFNLPGDFGPGRLEAPASAIFRDSVEPMHFYAFARLAGKLVEYDRFLTGLDKKREVGLAQFGGAFRYKALEIIYSQTFLSREYDEQPDEDSFASLTLMYRF